MRKKCVFLKKMCNFAPENIVEPFNHKRKGHANEYKVSTHLHRALATATGWLRQNLVVTMPCSQSLSQFNIAGSKACIVIYTHYYGQYKTKGIK